MGVALALLAMLSFAANMLITRYAVARMGLETGFLLVLGTNIVFPGTMYAIELATRAAPFSWDWKGCGLFALSGLIGVFLGRRALFDTVRLLGPSRASVFHSTSPAFALLGAWLLADERLGLYELFLVGLVWAGLWLTQPRAGSVAGAARLTRDVLRKGLVAGLFSVACFGFSNVVRGLAIRSWGEALLGSVIAALVAFALQILVTRDWAKIREQLRGARPGAIKLYVACGVASSLGSVFVTLAMTRLEIGLAVLVVHTTPVVVFPVSVLILKHREEITGRTVTGALLVLAGIAALAFR